MLGLLEKPSVQQWQQQQQLDKPTQLNYSRSQLVLFTFNVMMLIGRENNHIALSLPNHLCLGHLMDLTRHLNQCNKFVVVLALEQNFALELNESLFARLAQHIGQSIRYNRV